MRKHQMSFIGSHNTAGLFQNVGLMKIVINANFTRFNFPFFFCFIFGTRLLVCFRADCDLWARNARSETPHYFIVCNSGSRLSPTSTMRLKLHINRTPLTKQWGPKNDARSGTKHDSQLVAR